MKMFVGNRGVPWFDGTRGKKQVWRSIFEPKVFQKQMCCVLRKYLQYSWDFSALPTPPVIRRPGTCAPLPRGNSNTIKQNLR